MPGYLRRMLSQYVWHWDIWKNGQETPTRTPFCYETLTGLEWDEYGVSLLRLYPPLAVNHIRT